MLSRPLRLAGPYGVEGLVCVFGFVEGLLLALPLRLGEPFLLCGCFDVLMC
jgi:hypothetical protein